ncbi:hypothetical protein J2X97_001593 [Epilithonimonas hungarica]|uniref:hypothetical protein n=1 Tax=Epilithonimonas hungarica TaxID=454006 RepID=UPI002781C708|nr:hypothetical protein [Epilithonimonas hungarica]MDP9955956.1 hypothetical protein [Epilithonimonas hungarica]
MMKKNTLVSQFLVRTFGTFLLLISISGFAKIHLDEDIVSSIENRSKSSEEQSPQPEKAKIYVTEGVVITNLSNNIEIVLIRSRSNKKEKKKSRTTPVVVTFKPKKQKHTIIKQAVIVQKFIPKPYSSELLFGKASKLDTATITSSQNYKSKIYAIKDFIKFTLFIFLVIFLGFYTYNIEILKTESSLYSVRPPPFLGIL